MSIKLASAEAPAFHAPLAPYGAQAELDALQDDALARLLRGVAAAGYSFTAPTPLTHQRVLAHHGQRAGTTLRDIFGWSLPFAANALTHDLLAVMNEAGVLLTRGALLRSAVRIAAMGDDLFLHSAYPTIQDNAVFFGPDTYRFVRFIRQAVQEAGGEFERDHAALRILDIGCGSGAGAIIAARLWGYRSLPLEVVLNDINPLALRYAAVNARVAGVPVVLAQGDALSAVSGEFDLIVANPPYLDDAARRTYRHGGAGLGRALSVRMAHEALGRLRPGGLLILYSGVAIVDGQDPLRAELLPLLEAAGCEWSYEEIDPDVFSEEIERPIYAHVDRIAAVGLIARRKAAAAA